MRGRTHVKVVKVWRKMRKTEDSNLAGNFKNKRRDIKTCGDKDRGNFTGCFTSLQDLGKMLEKRDGRNKKKKNANR